MENYQGLMEMRRMTKELIEYYGWSHDVFMKMSVQEYMDLYHDFILDTVPVCADLKVWRDERKRLIAEDDRKREQKENKCRVLIPIFNVEFDYVDMLLDYKRLSGEEALDFLFGDEDEI